jgi:hypothetical protein
MLGSARGLGKFLWHLATAYHEPSGAVVLLLLAPDFFCFLLPFLKSPIRSVDNPYLCTGSGPVTHRAAKAMLDSTVDFGSQAFMQCDAGLGLFVARAVCSPIMTQH